MLDWYILLIVVVILVLVIVFFARIEAVRVTHNPGGGMEPSFRHYLIGLAIILKYCLAFPTALVMVIWRLFSRR